ncbi:MAG TPA: MauE/DoxX family redox-associated membrane protein [Cytophagaceae bacterium]|jgi:hypothetical protein|nr:MauE/DoxX family redox-associated membrane protein [Cytophagaceae bacterium]
MNKNKLLILFILRLLIFGLFMLSAILKLDPSILPFQHQLVTLGFADDCSAPYFSRMLIALEIALGISFLQSNYLKRIVIPATALLLVIFCVHLSYLIYTEGAMSGNCGCFGQRIPMTPLEALIKNIITLGILGYMYVIYREKEKNSIRMLTIIYLASNLAIFMLFPFAPCSTIKADELEILPPPTDTTLQVIAPDTLKKDSVAKPVMPLTPALPVTPAKVDTTKKVAPVVKTDALCPVKKVSSYAQFRKFSDGVVADLDDGRKIVTLFSLECEHCMETARKIGELSRKRTIPPTFFLFWGTEDQVENFFKVAQCRFPYKIIEPVTFFQLLGTAPSPPKVSVLCNGNLIADFDNNTFSSEKLEEVLNK